MTIANAMQVRNVLSLVTLLTLLSSLVDASVSGQHLFLLYG